MKTDFLLNRHFDTLIYGNLGFIIEYSTGIIKPKTISILVTTSSSIFYFLYFPTKIRYTGNDFEDTRTHKIFRGLESICYEMDLGNPIWLESTVRHFKKHGKARFYQDNFIEQIDFDYLEIQVIEEDDE